jgi:hypothetical protein
MPNMLINTAKAGLLIVALLLPFLANAEIVRLEMTVDSISWDANGMGVHVGDTLGYMEYDDTGLVRWDEATPWGDPGLTSVTYLTDFSFDFAGNHYTLEDLSFSQIYLDDDYLYENPYIFFKVETYDFNMNWLGHSPDLYHFEGELHSFESDDPDNPSNFFQMDISSTVVPIPTAVWLFGSGLGLLGWFRGKA